MLQMTCRSDKAQRTAMGAVISMLTPSSLLPAPALTGSEKAMPLAQTAGCKTCEAARCSSLAACL